MQVSENSIRPSPPKIGIVGHVGNQNLGDEAIIASVVQNIRQRWPNAEILGFTSVPGDTEARHAIRSYPLRQSSVGNTVSESLEGSGEVSVPQPANETRSWRDGLKSLLKVSPRLLGVARAVSRGLETLPSIGREVGFLARCRQPLKGMNLLIVAGSHQLNDFVDGPWAFPYTLLKWSFLARQAGASVVFLSMGAGPIETRLGALFLRRALKLASYRSYRDVTAQRVVDSLDVSASQRVVPDLAFGLSFGEGLYGTNRRTGRRVVGINPLPLYAEYWYTSDSSKYEVYVSKLARFSDWLVKRGCIVRFVSTQLLVDPAVIEDVVERMSRSAMALEQGLLEVPVIDDLDGLLRVISEVDMMVATRYHGVLLSLALNKPVLAIAYHRKTRDLMHWLGLENYVVEGDTFEARELIELFPLLDSESSRIESSLEEKVPELKSAVLTQYDEVFQLLD